jgi:hypothetical protein
MSVTERAFSLVKSIFTYEEAIRQVRSDIDSLSGNVGRLSQSHSALAERVAGIEGYLRAATRRAFDDKPQLPDQ